MQRGPELSVSLYDGPLGSNPALPCFYVTFYYYFLDIVMDIETSSSAFAGTDAQIKIKIFGTEGDVPETKISGSFEIGR